jgi:hypothetical protein
MNSTECPPPPTCSGAVNDPVKYYVYVIYGVLASLLIVSEALGMTPSTRYDAVLQVAAAALQVMSSTAARALPGAVRRPWICWRWPWCRSRPQEGTGGGGEGGAAVVSVTVSVPPSP